VLGVEYPETLTSVRNLAWVLKNQGKYETAEEMYRRALKGYEKVLGAEHPYTLNSVYCLAYLLDQRKNYGPACNLYQRAFQGFEISLGRDHPKTIQCRRHYFDVRKESGNS